MAHAMNVPGQKVQGCIDAAVRLGLSPARYQPLQDKHCRFGVAGEQLSWS